LEVIIGWFLFNRFSCNSKLEHSRDFKLLIVLIFFVLQPFSATIGNLILLSFGKISDVKDFINSWVSWWVGNGLAQSIFTPIILLILNDRSKLLYSIKSASFKLILMIPVVYFSLFRYSNDRTAISLALLVPILMWIAESHGLFSTSIACGFVVFSTITLTSMEMGPFFYNSEIQMLELNLFIFSISLTPQFVSILNHERAFLRNELEKQAHYDYLTGIANRRYFISKAENELKRCFRYTRDISLLMIDIDYFKKVNDNFGHPTGDVVLEKIANILKVQVRDIDFVGRIGGEEFAIILPETCVSDALNIASRLREIIENTEMQSVESIKNFKVTVSIGVATHNNDNTKFRELLSKADIALYKAKELGRNRVEVYTAQ
jgi:diguanylate cyclase (GGDEF)-like protein